MILGAGGHAKVLASLLLLHPQFYLVGFVDDNPTLQGTELLGKPVLGDRDWLLMHRGEFSSLFLGVGSVTVSTLRKDLFDWAQVWDFHTPPLVSPAAYIAPEVQVGKASVIMPRAVLQPGTVVGENVIVNTASTIDHDCFVGNHVHIAPGCVLSGGVHVGDSSHLGTGVVVIQGVHIRENTLVGAGAVVVHDLPAGVVALGVPARVREKNTGG
ncbi:MAG TPA: acetyltransferase [Thermotogota bacterium]|nr:acetyltransferase [Thermotogota bacterium]